MNKITFNLNFLIFFSISLIALLTDYLIFIFNLNYNLALILSFVSILIIDLLMMFKKKIKIELNFNYFDTLLFVVLGLIIYLTLAMPDFTYDTKNYHLYLQENFLIDKINFDFFAGKTINAFLFPLGDRMHYIFRNILGYRLRNISFLLFNSCYILSSKADIKTYL